MQSSCHCHLCVQVNYKCFTAITTTCVGEKYKVRVSWSVNWYFSLLEKNATKDPIEYPIFILKILVSH